MDISFIVILGLPVLYLTGSLKKIVANTNVSGRSFVLYFVCTAVLSLLPVLNITQNVSINLSGAFFCMAPAVYLAVKKQYNYKILITFAGIAIVAITVSFMFHSYTLPYLKYLISILISIIAIICFKKSAPVYVPVLIGIYSVFRSTMQLFINAYYQNVFFYGIEMISIAIVICLFFAYFTKKQKGRHSIQNNSPKKDLLT